MVMFLFGPGIQVQHFPHDVFPQECGGGKDWGSHNDAKQTKQVCRNNCRHKDCGGMHFERVGKNARGNNIIKDLVNDKRDDQDKQGVIER